jgi:hypothetical protein
MELNYLNTPLDQPEYVRVKFTNFPKEFIAKYKLPGFIHDCWVYFEMHCGIHGLPQAGILANNLLQDCLAKFNDYVAATAPGLWHHKWHPIMFALIVYNFAIQYIGNAHLDHLCQALRKHYEVFEELDGTCFAGMTLKWNYSPIHAKCHVTSLSQDISAVSAPSTSIPCALSTNSLLTSIAK